MPEERRVGMADMSEKLGYIAGRLDGLHGKVDGIKVDVRNNAGRITKVEKIQARVKHIAIGAVAPFVTGWTYVVLQWDKIAHFLGFGGGHGS